MTPEIPDVQQPELHCSHYTHLLDAQRGLGRCVTCRKILNAAPKNKCERHSLYLCQECFSDAQIQHFIFEQGLTK